MAAYYNEFDPFAAQWLRNLIAAGQIAPGDVDERSIQDVCPDDLRPYTQCHFFAGLGAWSLALRRAGWDDTRPIWTGSCPCQPFSQAGAGDGFNDPRHLWPDFGWLIWQCRPPIVVGEQVASKAADTWVDLVHADLEALGYAFGAVPFPAAGVGAPHIRDRLYWVAEPHGNGCSQQLRQPGKSEPACGSGFTASSGSVEREPGPVNGFWHGADWLSCRDDRWRPVKPGAFPLVAGVTAGVGSVQPGVRKLASRNRTGRLKGYGNALCMPAAQAFLECLDHPATADVTLAHLTH